MKILSFVFGTLIAGSAVPASATTLLPSFNGAGPEIAPANQLNPFFNVMLGGRSFTAVAPNARTTLVGTAAFDLTNLTLTPVGSENALKIDGARSGGSIVNFINGFGTNRFGPDIVTGVGKSPFLQTLITVRAGGEVHYLDTAGQGFALGALNATVPEPAAWAMLLFHFGLVGFARSRRTHIVAA